MASIKEQECDTRDKTPPAPTLSTKTQCVKRARVDYEEQERARKAARKKETEEALAELEALDHTSAYVLVFHIQEEADSCYTLVLPDTKAVNDAIDAIDAEKQSNEEWYDSWEILFQAKLAEIHPCWQNVFSPKFRISRIATLYAFN